MKPCIKLCGFQERESIAALDGLQVDMAGFILAPSKRQITLENLEELAACVPQGVKKAGVFVNPSVDDLRAVMAVAKLDVIQLHGKESPEFCRLVKDHFGVEVIKAVHISSSDEGPRLDNRYGSVIDYLLLDTFDRNAAGGTGIAFQWEVIPAYQAWCASHPIKLLVAGGITIDNVDELLERWQPDGIDVSSGIETNGRKDPVKIKRLIGKVRKNGSDTQ